MSTSDSQGKEPLTRKQLREIRLTGSTPVISAEEAAASAPVPPKPAPPVQVPPSPVVEDADPGSAPLTRRQARARERVLTASVPIADQDDSETDDTLDAPSADSDEVSESGEGSAVARSSAESEQDSSERAADAEIVSGVPAFAPVSAARDSTESPAPTAAEDDEATPGGNEATEAADTATDAPQSAFAVDGPAEDESATDLVALGVDAEAIEDIDDSEDDRDESAVERPTVNPSFGQSLLTDEKDIPAFTPSFDELITMGDSTGSQHVAPSALIFTPGPNDGSLSGPVASTGEVLITGTYDLPAGLGSQGHARGTTDGKDIDAVLIDGELPPASSPTPIAASSAVSTIKPAGEVIRPPAPEKGNKLMLVLAITAGGLALVLATALVIAFSMNVF